MGGDPAQSGNKAGIQTILRNGGLVFSARLTAQGARFLYIVMVVRMLGPELYGLLAYVHAWGLLLLPFVNLGSQTLLSRSFGNSFESGRSLAQRLWTLRLLSIPLLVAVLLVVAKLTEPDPKIFGLFYLMGATLFGRGIATLCNHVLVANHSANQVLRIEAIFRLGELVFAAVALFFGAGLVELLAIHAAIWWLQALAAAWWVGVTLFVPAWRWSDLGFKALLGEGVLAMTPGLSLFFLVQGPLIVGRHLGNGDGGLGELALAVQILGILVAVPAAIGVAALPVLSGSGNTETGKIFSARLVPISILAALVVAGVGAVAGPSVINFVFGAEYIEASHYLTLGLFFVLVPLAPVALLSQAVVARTRDRSLFRAAWPAALGCVTGALAITSFFMLFESQAMLLVGTGLGAFIWLAALVWVFFTTDPT